MPDDSAASDLAARCRLDPAGFDDQLGRYRALARHVESVDRRADRVTIRFRAGFDVDLVEETLAIECQCCSFFRLDFDSPARRLSISVDCPEHRPALEAVIGALAPSIVPATSSRRSLSKLEGVDSAVSG